MALAACLLVLTQPPALPCEWRDELPSDVAKIVREVDEKHKKEIEDDIKIGREASDRVRKEIPLSENVEYVQKILKIGDSLSAVANRTLVQVTWGDSRLSPFNYEFQVLKGDDVNAFSLPGGFIYIYEGVLKFSESDDEVAGVVAHEIAHASLRHIATLRREQSKFDLVNIPLILAAILSGSSDSGKILTGTQLLNQAVMSGWSVKAEEAADYAGLQYMLASDYRPVGMLTFMERLAFRDRGSPNYDFGIYQTHPPSSERARSLIRRLKQYNIPIKRSEVTKSLKSQVLPADDGAVQLKFGKTLLYTFGGTDALVRADQAAAAMDQFFDTVPALYEAELRDERLIGGGKTLFEALPADGNDTAGRMTAALAALKKILFDLNYRLWQNHDRVSGL